MSPTRTLTVPAPYAGQPDATLRLQSLDGEVAEMRLVSASGVVIAAAGEFWIAECALETWLDCSDQAIATVFGGFLAAELERSCPSGEWTTLSQEASDWVDALALLTLNDPVAAA